jgi:PAS domain S-box-containing protein
MTDLSKLEQDLARLRETEITLHQILDNSTTVRVFAKDLDGRYLFVNRAFEQHVGRPQSEIVGRTPADLAPSEIAAALRANDRRVIETGCALEIEETNVIRGERRTLLANKFPLLGPDGRPYAVCGISIDITERKRFAEALQQAAVAMSTAGGERVFDALAVALTAALDVDAVMIAVFADDSRSRMRTLATCLDGRVLRSFEYELAKTPCAGVVGREFRFVGQGVQPEFAPGTMFQALGFDSYAAYALSDAAGVQLGLIAALDRGPMTNRALTESLLKIFAARAAAEIERARAEEALRHSEASYRSIFEASEDPIFIHDWDTGAILDVSPKAAEVYGYSREEMRQLPVGVVSANQPGHTAADAARYIQQAKVRSTPVRFEWHARHKDGHLMWHEVTLKRATIAGEPRILAFTRDITERKLADEALRASEEQYRAVFNATADGLVLRDADNRIVDVNPALLAMTGYAREDLVGAKRWLFVRPNEDEEAAARARRVLAGETSHRETQAVRKDGTPFDVEVRSVPIQYRGRPHVLAMAREITARRLADEALRASEEQYRAVFNATADALVLRDADNCIVDVNPALLAMTGYAREDLVGKQRWAFLPPAEDALGRELHRRVIAGEPVQHETVGVRKDGTRFDVEVRSVPIQYRGRPHVLAMARDITARRLAEEALRSSEEQYRAIFNASDDALVLWNSELKRVDCNPAYEKIYGFTREEVISETYPEHFPPEYRERRRELARRTLEGEPCHLELESVRKNGERFFAEIRTIPVRHRGEPHVLAIARDITERKRAEEAFRASEAQYRAIFNATADALVLRDADFRIVDVNPAYEAMSGYARDEVVGADRVIAHPDRINGSLVALHQKVLAGEPIHLETEGLRKDGTRILIELRGVPIQHQGRPHVLYIGRDITARKRAEAERLGLETQLRQAQKMEAIGHLTGGIAHDFNNILTSIMGYVTLATERPGAVEDRKLGNYLEQALLSSRRARDLIQQMLTFSRGQRGERRPLDLRRVAAESARLLRSSMPSTLELETVSAADVPLASLDRVQSEQVLLNLCINARDALGGHGKVRVSVGRSATRRAVCTSCRAHFDGEFVELAVADDGPGIPPEVMERMFEPFFSTKEVGKGSGMGLATVHGIVHEHGGHVVVESAPGRGATFRVLFPVLRADDQTIEHETLPGYVPASRKPGLQGRVLLVDDEESVVGFMRELLESWGLEVTARRSGPDARQIFADEPDRYDLVITDQTMPRMTGLELARELAAIRPDLPVILYTGYADGVMDAQVEAAAVRAVLRKPVEPAQLLALLRACLAGVGRAAR